MAADQVSEIFCFRSVNIRGKNTPTGKLVRTNGKKKMLYTLALILIIAWLLGMVSSYTIGGLIHILLIVAIILVLVRIIQGRRPL